MSKYYPEIRKKETLRVSFYATAMLIPLIALLAGFIVFGLEVKAGIFFIISLFLSYCIFRISSIKLSIKCPQCDTGFLVENYEKSPRGIDENVEHKCASCGAKYIDGWLQK